MTISQDDLAFDRQHIWHPYTNLTQPGPVFGVSSAEGVYIHLADGRRLVDGMASWWSVIHGYNHPYLNAAIQSQVTQMSHVMFGGLTHQPAIDLSKQLLDMTDEALDAVFLADSGSVAVEVALKMALQYWVAKGISHKKQFIAFRHAYHGDTFGAMSVCDPVNGMHSMFSGFLPQHHFVDAPPAGDDDNWQASHIEPLRQTLEQNHQNTAAVIIEPLVQGAGGMRFYAAEYLRQLHQLCQQFDVLLIFDEIATGFGRTGEMFAYQSAMVVPDILCVGKAITGGYMSLAATLTTRKIADIIGSFEGGNLMHGPTFMANPLSCRVAVASLELLLRSNWQQKVKSIAEQLTAELAECRQYQGVVDVRVKGAIGVVELIKPVNMHKIQPQFVDLGVWIRPFGRLVYIMPPYIIEPPQLTLLCDAIKTVTKQL
ncbi:adenosylmethionine--8-amino-7-oxononanoate transaminase [Aliikangiella maris]|uniref:Adenosylmethionine--8-amino-7-oxononanoate transaminase n=2 Tax=Aliikangiella maris TaxID=3162458 RepID=A0ABV2BU45_9GAMM